MPDAALRAGRYLASSASHTIKKANSSGPMGLNETGRLNESEHCKMVLNVRMHGSPMQSRLTVVESVSYNIM